MTNPTPNRYGYATCPQCGKGMTPSSKTCMACRMAATDAKRRKKAAPAQPSAVCSCGARHWLLSSRVVRNEKGEPFYTRTCAACGAEGPLHPAEGAKAMTVWGSVKPMDPANLKDNRLSAEAKAAAHRAVPRKYHACGTENCAGLASPTSTYCKDCLQRRRSTITKCRTCSAYISYVATYCRACATRNRYQAQLVSSDD